MLTSITSPYPVYRLRPGRRTDSVGDEVTSWDTPTSKRIPRAVVDDAQGGTTQGRIDGTADLLIIGAFDIVSGDRVEYRGEVWRIDGKPITRRSLATGDVVEVRLKRLEVTR
ncbi:MULTISPECIES: hypothetical protein [unclassified Microbacterium]|uniref:hypothetical protein n=1 Tax=unclassified Microbacterium TaxID=2609290 RepID=UPI00042982A6|nr:hypothetical protein [Microbacterium sp. B24]